YRITEDKIRKTKDESVYRFVNKTDSMIHEFLKTNPAISSHPILGNSEIDVPNIEYDLVITSPPYGDSKTTVAYGQYSSFGSEWIRGLNKYETMTYDVDKECLGKSGYINKGIYNCKPLMDILTVIKDKDRKRYLDVLYFFNGYLKSIIRTAINLKEGGKMCFVVGNRTVKGFQIPMDQITAYFMDEIGLTFKEILVRNILNKVMPYKNSPTNQSGVKSKTMTKEYIVIFRK
ncbi:MAG: DNA modification methylase, partial [Gemmatimonadota bacterium]|nr:DNA modification methylase [Gemmatimonadota bacterium]